MGKTWWFAIHSCCNSFPLQFILFKAYTIILFSRWLSAPAMLLKRPQKKLPLPKTAWMCSFWWQACIDFVCAVSLFSEWETSRQEQAHQRKTFLRVSLPILNYLNMINWVYSPKQCSKYIHIYVIGINILSSRTTSLKDKSSHSDLQKSDWSGKINNYWMWGELFTMWLWSALALACVKVSCSMLVGEIIALPWVNGC